MDASSWSTWGATNNQNCSPGSLGAVCRTISLRQFARKEKMIDGEGERDWESECIYTNYEQIRFDVMNAFNGPTKFELVFARFDSTRRLLVNNYIKLPGLISF